MAEAKIETKPETKETSKINQRACGDPLEMLKTMPADQLRGYMGTIIGAVDGISRRTNADGEGIEEGLRGDIEAFNASKNITTLAQAVFFPAVFAAPYLNLFRKTPAPELVLMGVEVAIVRAKAAPGYNWEITPLVADENTANPLHLAREKMKAAVATRAIAQKAKK